MGKNVRAGVCVALGVDALRFPRGWLCLWSTCRSGASRCRTSSCDCGYNRRSTSNVQHPTFMRSPPVKTPTELDRVGPRLAESAEFLGPSWSAWQLAHDKDDVSNPTPPWLSHTHVNVMCEGGHAVSVWNRVLGWNRVCLV